MLFGKHKVRTIIEIPTEVSKTNESLKKTCKEITARYIKRKMDYTNLNTREMQVKYIKTIYGMKIHEAGYLKITELRKLAIGY